MKSPLRSTRHVHQDWAMDNRDMMLALGLQPGGHLPEEGMPARYIQGVVVYVNPQVPRYRPDGRKVKSSTHRIIAVCPQCGKDVPFGRLSQHYVVHAPKVEVVS